MGYLHVKDVLELDEQDRAVPAHVWRPMATLRAGLPLDDALSAMRASASHLAGVADDSGRVLGVAALEDVLEMLVGEVHDPAHRSVMTGSVMTGSVTTAGEEHPDADRPAPARTAPHRTPA